jgi:hypothetical protein
LARIGGLADKDKDGKCSPNIYKGNLLKVVFKGVLPKAKLACPPQRAPSQHTRVWQCAHVST